MKLARSGLMVVIVAGLGGCMCKPQVKDVRPLPAVISLEEQVGRLNARARMMPMLTMGGTVVFRYQEDGREQKQSADGRLLIRQRFGEEGAGGGKDAGDIFLQVRGLNQEVFRAGKNEREWWFLNYRANPKKAWVGEVSGEASGMGEGGSGGVMRADTVLEALGVTEILPRAGSAGVGGIGVAMVVDDAGRANRVMEIRGASGGNAWVKREVVVDRDSGEVRQVNLYDGRGVVVVRADLADYREVKYREGDEVPAGFVPPKFPFDIWISYPGQKASVHFTVHGAEGERAELRERLPEAAFMLPDLEGFEVVRVRSGGR